MPVHATDLNDSHAITSERCHRYMLPKPTTRSLVLAARPVQLWVSLPYSPYSMNAAPPTAPTAIPAIIIKPLPVANAAPAVEDADAADIDDEDPDADADATAAVVEAVIEPDVACVSVTLPAAASRPRRTSCDSTLVIRAA